MMSYQLTLGGLLERAGRLFADVELVSRKPDSSIHRYTYAEFRKRARALAESLQRAGIKRGDRVATLMANHHVHLEAFFGVPAAGCVVHTINTRLHPNDLSYIINHAGDRVIIIDEALVPVWEQFKERVDVERVIVVSENRPAARPYIDYESFLRDARDEFKHPSMHENEAAVLCYTTGTAGTPKGVAYSHRALVLNAMAVALPDALCLSERDTVLPIVPMHHANAWGLPVAATLVGARQVLPGMHIDEQSVLELLEQEQVTVSAGVPGVWMGILHALQKRTERPKLAPTLRAIVSGAAPPPSLIHGLDEQGIKVVQAWGLVETGPLATFANVKPSLAHLTPEEKYDLRATQGTPLPFVDLRAVGESGEAPRDGTTLGEVQIRGPWVAGAYYNLPELRGKWTDDGWFRTGDVATIDPNGYLKLADRAKDLIRSGDDWISSVNLENELMGHPAVREAAVIAVPHPRWQERPLATVVLKEGEQVSAEELRKYLAQRFAEWQVPDAIVFLAQLPHTPTGKLLKKELRRQFHYWKWEESTPK
jgi:fatty-acyl-CoA synthase